MRKFLKYLFLGVGILYTYAMAKVLSRALGDDEHEPFDDSNDMLIH